MLVSSAKRTGEILTFYASDVCQWREKKGGGGTKDELRT